MVARGVQVPPAPERLSPPKGTLPICLWNSLELTTDMGLELAWESGPVSDAMGKAKTNIAGSQPAASSQTSLRDKMHPADLTWAESNKDSRGSRDGF